MKYLKRHFLPVAAMVLAGCAGLPGDHQRQTAPALQLSNVQASPIPSSIRRVAMLPVYSTQTDATARRDLDGIFRAELSKMIRFEVSEVSRPDLAAIIRVEQISSV